MIRTQIFFTKRQKRFFKREAKKLQITTSSLIRRALDKYIEEKQKNE